MASAKFDQSGIPTILGVDSVGVIHPVLTDTSGTLLTSNSSAPADISQTGAISGNTSVTLALTGQASVTVQIINTGFTGTLNFEESNDGGTTYQSVALWPVGSTVSGNLIISKAFTTDSSTSLYEGNVSAASNFRVRGSSVSAGSSAITIRAGLSTSSVVLDGPLPSGSNTIGTVGVTNVSGTYPNAPTSVASANSDTALLGVNAARKLAIISNDSTAKLYVLYDQSGVGAASATNFSIVVPPGSTLESPDPVFTGRIRGFWSAANGTAAVTEVT